MKRSALTFLVCPACKLHLDLHVDEEVDAEISRGHLICCRCRERYPIVRGVPRFVGSGSYASSFGRQWNWFRTVQLDSANGTRESEQMLAGTTGWQPADYAGRLVLDAGVGCGRFAEIVAKHGGEVVGVDLTSAVDAAYLNIGRRPHVHLVQADIFAMPFRDEAFDLAYSIGVLHHTPDPRAAFERVVATVKQGGGFAFYLYARYGVYRGADTIRKVTTRLPVEVMLAVSAIAIPLYYVYRLPVLGKVLQLVCPISLHRNWRWRWLDTFDWYTPKYQWKFQYPEVFRWIDGGRFCDVRLFNDAIRMRVTKSSSPVQDRVPVSSEAVCA